MLDWSGEDSPVREAWQKLLTSVPEPMKPGFQLMSQIEPYRQSLRDGKPLELARDPEFEKSVLAAISSMSDGPRYPTVHHSIAECYALALKVYRRTESSDESIAKKLAEHRLAAVNSLSAANAAGFYSFGDRLEQIRKDPLFQEDVFQAVFDER